MYQIKTYNKISNAVLSSFSKNTYTINGMAEPDALLIRTQNLNRGILPVSLLAIGRAGTEVNNIPLTKASENGVVVFNSPGANSNAVKELIIAVLIMAARPIIPAVNWLNTLKAADGVELSSQVEAGKNNFRGTELIGKTLGVIGLGATGSKVADTAKQLGMKVIGYDPNISVEHAWELSNDIPRARTINDVLKNSDYVTIHIPNTKDNQQLISQPELATMKQSAVLLNYSHNDVVDEKAILIALETGEISQYMTDFISADLVEHDKVVITPHLGGNTTAAAENSEQMVADTLRKYLETGEISHSVNFPTVSMPFNSPFRLILLHQNVPSMVSKIATILAELNINIANMINASKGPNAYTMIDVDEINNDLYAEFENKCLNINAVIRVRGISNPQINK